MMSGAAVDVVGNGKCKDGTSGEGERTSANDAVPERISRADSGLVVDYLWYPAVVACAFDGSAEPGDIGRDLHPAVMEQSARV